MNFVEKFEYFYILEKINIISKGNFVVFFTFEFFFFIFEFFSIFLIFFLQFQVFFLYFQVFFLYFQFFFIQEINELNISKYGQLHNESNTFLPIDGIPVLTTNVELYNKVEKKLSHDWISHLT